MEETQNLLPPMWACLPSHPYMYCGYDMICPTSCRSVLHLRRPGQYIDLVKHNSQSLDMYSLGLKFTHRWEAPLSWLMGVDTDCVHCIVTCDDQPRSSARGAWVGDVHERWPLTSYTDTMEPRLLLSRRTYFCKGIATRRIFLKFRDFQGLSGLFPK